MLPRVVRRETARMTAAFIATTASETGEVARRILDARETARPLRVVGAGTWLSDGVLVDATETVSPLGHAGVIEYVPGDLTITVGAGMSLGAIAEATAAHDQWLTLESFGSPSGTIGATVATASSGPLSTGFGTPRDIVLGLEVVTGTEASFAAAGAW